MRTNCEIFIELDFELAFKSGIKFWESNNKVILSNGINGVISPIFFKNVYQNIGE